MFETVYPYDALAKHGINVRSSVKEIQDFYPTEKEESDAWRVLKDPSSRLKTDFFLYQVQDEDRLAAFQEHLYSTKVLPSHQDICHQLDEDAPVLLLLMGERRRAQEIWEGQQQQNPANDSTAHRLALLYYAEGQHYEETGDYDRATQMWRLAIANWVCALASDAYWQSWYEERQKWYGKKRRVDRLSPSLIGEVRDTLLKHLAMEFSDYAAYYWQKEDQKRTQMYRELEILYEVERQGTEALRAAGGLNVKGGQSIVCGPLLLRHLGLEKQLGELVAGLQKDLDQYMAMPVDQALRSGKGPEVSGEKLKQIRLYFSELSYMAALLNLNRPKETVSSLLGMRRGQSDFENKNPAYSYLEDRNDKFQKDATELAIQAHILISQNCITSSSADLLTAAAAWKDALRQGRKVGMEKEAIKAISDLAIGRVSALKGEEKRDQIERLNEAIALLESVQNVLNYADEGEIASELADALFCRGNTLFFQDYYERAIEDLRRAFNLNPHNIKIRDDYCTVLIHYAIDRDLDGHKDEAISLLEKAKNLVEAGLRENPMSELLQETRQFAQTELDRLIGKESGEDIWEALDKAIEESRQKAGQSDNRITVLINSAESKREQKNYSSAIADLEQALLIDPDHALTKAEITRTFVYWARDLLLNGDVREAEEKVDLGLKQRTDEPALLEIKEQIRFTKEILGPEGETV